MLCPYVVNPMFLNKPLNYNCNSYRYYFIPIQIAIRHPPHLYPTLQVILCVFITYKIIAIMLIEHNGYYLY